MAKEDVNVATYMVACYVFDYVHKLVNTPKIMMLRSSGSVVINDI